MLAQSPRDLLGTGNLGFPENWPEAIDLQDPPMGTKVPQPPADLFLFGLELLFPGGYFQTQISHNHNPPKGTRGKGWVGNGAQNLAN